MVLNSFVFLLGMKVRSFSVDLRYSFTVRNMEETPVLVQSNELSKACDTSALRLLGTCLRRQISGFHAAASEC